MLGTTLTASTLASIPAPGWDGFDIGPFKVHAYALCIITGAALAFWLGSRRWKQRGGPEGSILDVGIWAVLAGLVGARAYHVLFTAPDYYFGENADGSSNLIEILYIWNGGIGIMGAISVGALGAWASCRYYGFRFSAFADVVAPGILLAQGVGRLGNYFNQELFGSETDLPWGLEVDYDHANFPHGEEYLPDTLFHPTFLYEMLWCFVGVAVLLLIDRKLKLRRGMMLWSYVVWYSVGRIWMETLRIDHVEELTILGITQRLHGWNATVLLIVAVVMLIVLWVRRPQTEEEKETAETIWLPGRKPEDDESGDSEETGDSTESDAETDSDVSVITDQQTDSDK